MWMGTERSPRRLRAAEARARELMAAHGKTFVLPVHQPGFRTPRARCSGPPSMLGPLRALLRLKARAPLLSGCLPRPLSVSVGSTVRVASRRACVAAGTTAPKTQPQSHSNRPDLSALASSSLLGFSGAAPCNSHRSLPRAASDLFMSRRRPLPRLAMLDSLRGLPFECGES